MGPLPHVNIPSHLRHDLGIYRILPMQANLNAMEPYSRRHMLELRCLR